MSRRTPEDRDIRATDSKTVATSPSAMAALSSLRSFEKRCRIPRLITVILVIALLGAALGGIAFALRSQPATATAMIRLTQPPDFAAIAGGAGYSTPDPQPITEGYVAGEVEFLNGDKFADALGTSSGSAELSVEQAGTSSVVVLRSSAESADQAIESLSVVIDVYGQELDQRISAQLGKVLPALDQWQTAAVADVLRTAEIARLREALLVQAQQARSVAVLQPPTRDKQATPPWLTGALVGAVASGGAAWFFVMRRRRKGQSSLISQVADSVDGVLLPPVKLDGAELGPSSHISLARTLYAQIPNAGAEQSIAVYGSTPRSGTARIAALMQVAADEGPGVTIEDAGSIDAPTRPGSAMPDSGPLVIVLRIDTDTPKSVLPLLAAASRRSGPTLAAFTYESWWRGLQVFPSPVR